MGEKQSQELPEKEAMSDATAAGEETVTKDNDAGDEVIIVLKVYMHCDACARKVTRSLKGFPGVEDVIANSNEGILRVKGRNADPVEVHQRVQEKCRSKVELISPLPKPPTSINDKKQEGDKEPPTATMILLNIQMHCEACARVIRKKLLKIKGVETARTDLSINQVAVTGIVDPTELVDQVYKRTKKIATIVPPPAPPPLEESKRKTGEHEKIDGENSDVNGEETNFNKEEDVKRNQIWPTRHFIDHYQSHYAFPYPPPPQIFSDENPNACFIM